MSSPIGGAPLAHVPQSSSQDVAEAYVRARRAQASWAATSLDERAAALLRLHDLLLDRQEELIDLVVWESGKARKDAYLEVAHLALTARYYARTAHEHLDTRRVGGMFPVLTRTEVGRVPKGVVGIISPWNYPLTMALCDGLPALLAGNAVVAKPDAQTMLTALLAARLLDDAGFPAEIWQVVAGPGPEIGGAVVAGADYVCFTGSTATGRLIARQCADRLIGCSLELGGKNPMLVLRDADVQRAAEGAVRGVFANAGQLCVSLERLFVADQVYDRFVDAFVSRTQALTLGASLDWSVDMGSLISQAQLDTVTAHVEDAVAKGARVLTGGRARPDLGPFVFEPTDPRGRLGRHGVLRPRDLRPGRLALPLPQRGRGGRARQRRALRAQRLDLDPRRRARAGARPPHPVRHRQRQRGLRRDVRLARRADGRHARVRDGPPPGCRGHPPLHRGRSPSRPSASSPIAPMLGMSEETNAKVLTASLRLLNKLGVPESPRTAHPLRRPGHRLRLRRLGHRPAAGREGLHRRRARGRAPASRTTTSRRPRSTPSGSSSPRRWGCTASSASTWSRTA